MIVQSGRMWSDENISTKQSIQPHITGQYVKGKKLFIKVLVLKSSHVLLCGVL